MSTTCTVDQLKQRLDENEPALLLDVREYPEYAGGHVAGARLAPLGQLETLAATLPKTAPVYVMCRSGNRSAQAQKKLEAIGFRDVRNVAGGITAWSAQHYPVERAAKAPWAMDRQVRLVAGSLVIAGVVMSRWSKLGIALAGFVGVGLAQSAILDNCAMAHLLARMPWNRNEEGQSCSH